MAKKSEKLGGATANVNDDFRAQMDAAALTRAQGIRVDDKRHKAALNHMKKKAGSVMAAADMEKKAAKGLSRAFPEDGGCEGCGKRNCNCGKE